MISESSPATRDTSSAATPAQLSPARSRSATQGATQGATHTAWLDRDLLSSIDWEKLAYLVLIAIAILSRFWDLGTRVISFDESEHTYFSWALATGRGFAHTPLLHGPFLFHITALSYFLFGADDFTSRIPAAVFGVALVALPYFFRRWLGRPGALITSFAILISPSLLYYARYIRQEAFIVVWTTLTVLCIWRYLETRGAGWLVGLAAVLAFHASDKSTSFLNVAMLVVFLAPLALAQLYAARRRWADVRLAIAFTATVGVAMLLGAIVFEAIASFAQPRIGMADTVIKINPPGISLNVGMMIFVGMIVILAILTTIGLLVLLRRVFGQWLTAAREGAPAFNVLVVLVTTTMFMASPALLLVLNPLWRLTTGADLVLVSALGDMANLASNPAVIARMFALALALLAVALPLGLAWHPRRWLAVAAVFAAITVTLFTSVFSNPGGIGTGFVGQLGYWMAQQGVQRGSQPPYYYFLIVPLYEYILVIGTLCALGYILYRVLRWAWVWSSTPRRAMSTATTIPPADSDAVNVAITAPQPLVRERTEAIEEMLAPRRIFPLLLAWWSIATWIIYSIAGEKMPWLTVHFALPMTLLTGWFVGRVAAPFFRSTPAPSPLEESTRRAKKVISRRLAITALAVLIVFLIVWLLALVNSLDLVPGDSVALVRWLATAVLALAGIGLAGVLLRRFTKWAGRIVLLAAFAFLAVLTARTAFMASYINYDSAREFLVYAHGGPGAKLVYNQLVELNKRATGIKIAHDRDVNWPINWYMRDFPNVNSFSDDLPTNYADYDAILIGSQNPKRSEAERALASNYTASDSMLIWWPMQDYYDLTGQRIAYSLLNPPARAALWDIIFNRDFTRYSQVFTKTSLTPDKWSPGHRFVIYLRNDIATKVWTYSAGTITPAVPGAPTARLSSPAGIAVAPDGAYVVVDHQANRLFRFAADGTLLASFGGPGPAAAKFNDPWGVALAPDGTLFVADTFNHRIQKFDPTGAFLLAWGTPGASQAPGLAQTTSFFGPRALAFDAQGQLLVADTGNKRIQVFSLDGAFVTQFGSPGSGDGQFNEPVGLAVDATGAIYVADTWNRRIQVFDRAFQFVRQFAVPAWAALPQDDLQSVDHKPYLALHGDTLLLSSPATHQVLAFTLAGQPVDLPGVTLPADSRPTGLAVHADTLLVTDAANARVLTFTLAQSGR